MVRTLFTSRDGGDLKLPSNRELLRTFLTLDRLHFMRQTHSAIVRVVGEDGGDFECDALVTTSRGVGLAALAADCMPVIFTSEGVVGVAHIGRVGLVAEIASKVIAVMHNLGAEVITASIGPSICARCYEVSSEMYQEIITKLPATATSRESHALDLRNGLRSQLLALGVLDQNIGISSVCTKENPRYFSYRGGDLQSRQAGIVSL